MHTLALMQSAQGLIVPRRLQLDAAPGTGRLGIAGRVDAAFAASVTWAWHTAKRIANRHDLDLRLTLHSPVLTTGASAGLPFGLAALALLWERALPPHLATGGIAPDGSLVGGAGVAAKHGAATGLLSTLGWEQAVFVAPPLHDPPVHPRLPVRCALDLAQAARLFFPDGPTAEPVWPAPAKIPADAPEDCVLVHGGCPSAHADVPVLPQAALDPEAPEVVWLRVVRGGRIMWSRPAAKADTATINETWRLALRWAPTGPPVPPPEAT